MTEAVRNVTTVIWPFAAILLSFVMVQAAMFMVNALRFNKKYNLYSRDELVSIAKSATVSTIVRPCPW